MEASVGSIHEARGTTNKLKQRQTPIIFHCAGLQALKVCDHFQFDRDDDKYDPCRESN